MTTSGPGFPRSAFGLIPSGVPIVGVAARDLAVGDLNQIIQARADGNGVTSEGLPASVNHFWRSADLFEPNVAAATESVAGASGARFAPAAPWLFNGGSFDASRNNHRIQLLASAARTATTTTGTLTTFNAKAVTLVLSITANPGAGETLQVALLFDATGAINPQIGITAVGVAGTINLHILSAGRGAVDPWVALASMNQAQVETAIPRSLFATVFHSGAGSWTYSLDAELSS